jgi:GTPase
MGAPAREPKANPDKAKLEKIAARMEREHDLNISEMAIKEAAIKAQKDMLNGMITEMAELKKGFDKSVREISVNDLAEMGGVNKNKMYEIMDVIGKIEKNKEAKKK